MYEDLNTPEFIEQREFLFEEQARKDRAHTLSKKIRKVSLWFIGIYFVLLFIKAIVITTVVDNTDTTPSIKNATELNELRNK